MIDLDNGDFIELIDTFGNLRRCCRITQKISFKKKLTTAERYGLEYIGAELSERNFEEGFNNLAEILEKISVINNESAEQVYLNNFEGYPIEMDGTIKSLSLSEDNRIILEIINDNYNEVFYYLYD